MPLAVSNVGLTLTSARCQFSYWEDGSLRIVNYLTRRTFSANPVVLELLGFFFEPRSLPEALVRFKAYQPQSVARAIMELIALQLLLEHGSPAWQRDERVQSLWKGWLPEGGFHFLTKDAPYVGQDWDAQQILEALPQTPAPPQTKTIADAEAIHLPPDEGAADVFFDTLHARRTHRSFSRQGIPLQQVSKLLRTTWGIQGYLKSEPFGQLPFKTSPSGGARHPVEAYVMALNVEGLEAGTYHFQAERHILERVNAKASPALASAYCADQPYAGEAAAIFIMTAVFARTMWKYRHPRAYRVVLLEAGHLGQTFCLTATRLGLGAFCTAALKDTLIETDLGLDGIAESVLYVLGVGRRPGA